MPLFLNPNLLTAGLLCISIPILIHILLRRRRRPVAWGAMRFLLEAFRQQRRRLRLEQILLLAARCLLVALVAFAIGKPLFARGAAGAGRGPRTLAILIDNSLAGSARDGEGRSALAVQKERASALLAQLDPSRGDRVALVALGGPAEALVVPPSVDIPAVARLVGELRETSSSMDLEGASALLGKCTPEDGISPLFVGVLSDFRAGSLDARRAAAWAASAEDRRVVLAPEAARTPLENVAIASVEPQRPVLIGGGGSSWPVRVVLRRSGSAVSQPGATRVTAWVEQGAGEGAPAEEIVRWGPGEEERAIQILTPGGDAGPPAATAPIVRVRIDRDAVEADNEFRRPVPVRESLAVALVSSRTLSAVAGLDRGGVERFTAADWIALALEPRMGTLERFSEVRLTWIEPGALASARLREFDAILFPSPDRIDADGWRRTREYVDSGGVAFIWPPAGLNVHMWTDPMTAALATPWTYGRTEVEGVRTLAWEGASRPAWDPFAQISGEMPELVKPVVLSRWLDVEPATDAGQSPVLLSTTDGTALIVAGRPGRGDEAQASRGLVVSFGYAPELAWTNLPAKPLFLPLMHELLRQSIGRSAPSGAQTAGALLRLPPGASEAIRIDGGPAQSLSAGPGGYTAEPVRSASVWRAVDGRGAYLATVAVNADASASSVQAQDTAEVRAALASLAGGAERVRELTPEWRLDEGVLVPGAAAGAKESPWSVPLLGAALLLALLELVMARYFSHATATRRESALEPQAGLGRAA